jgi:pilus assembly protein CpaB
LLADFEVGQDAECVARQTMRAKSLVLVVVALGCGLVASIGTSQLLRSRAGGAGNAAPLEKIFVAATDVGLGQKLDKRQLKVAEWPKDRLPVGAIRKLEDVVGKRPLTRLYAGEPILKAKLVEADKLSAAAEKIPKGFRVASVSVTMDSSASGLIYPGDRVDVLVFLRQGANVKMPRTRTILKNVTVFAVDDRFQRDANDDGEGLKAKTVSLLVKPTQVEKIMLAAELGKIKLSLRSAEDNAEDTADGATLADLQSGSSRDGESATRPVADWSDPLEDSLTPSPSAAAPVKAVESVGNTGAAEPAKSFRMRVYAPDGVHEFHWDAPDGLPREVRPGDAPVSLPWTPANGPARGTTGLGPTPTNSPDGTVPQEPTPVSGRQEASMEAPPGATGDRT